LDIKDVVKKIYRSCEGLNKFFWKKNPTQLFAERESPASFVKDQG
jgi:hypothetical protein